MAQNCIADAQLKIDVKKNEVFNSNVSLKGQFPARGLDEFLNLHLSDFWQNNKSYRFIVA